MLHDRVQPLQFNEKEQSCVKLANPPTQTSNKKKKKDKNRKNALFPDPEERDIPKVSKSVEIATSNDMSDVDSFSELLQLPVDEEVIPTQLSSSLVKPKRRATPTQTAHSELEKRSIIVYGVPQSKAELAADRVRLDIKSLE